MSGDADLDVALRAARAAGALLLERFRGPARGVERKTTGTDLVSDADRDAETVVREILTSARPDDGLLAEEGSQAPAASGRRWIVDPLDGTTNFLFGIPIWAVSVALEDERGMAVGVVHVPTADETFTAVRGAGAWLHDQPLRCSTKTDLATALVGTGFGYEAQRRAEQAQLLTTLLPLVRDIRRAGAAAIDLCWAGCGRLDAYFERGVQPWDWAAGSLVASEAGARVSFLDGPVSGIVASAPGVAAELERLVAT